ALDITGLKEPMVFEAQMVGYPLRFGQGDLMFKNIQGFLMQVLTKQTPTGTQPMPGMFVFPASNPASDSDRLHYSRHEFNTYFLQHQERQPHAVDPTDGNWHLDGSRHIDHDHLILAIFGKMNDGSLPAPGPTPPFDLTMTTYSLFYQDIVGASSVTLQNYAAADSFDSNTAQAGYGGDVFSKGTVTVKDDAVVFGDTTGAKINFGGDGKITGAAKKSAAGADVTFMSIIVPTGIPSLGAINLNNTNQTINGPGSFVVTSMNLTKTSRLFIDNSNGPVTLYVTGKISVKDTSTIDVAD